MSIDDAWSVRAEGEEIRPEEKREKYGSNWTRADR